jgi:hypothetical protein
VSYWNNNFISQGTKNMSEQKFKHISIGKDGSVWAAGKTDGTIFRLFGNAGFVWVPDKQGKAEVIAAVDWGNAWCVNSAHEIWHLTNAGSLDKGGTWTRVPTHSGRADAKTISAGKDGSVWYAQTDGTLFRTARPGDGTEVGFWVQDKVGKADVIAAVDGTTVYCINKDHQIWFGQNGNWSQISTHSGRADAKSIAVNPDGYAWYSSTDGAVFRRIRPGDGVGLPPWGTSWDRRQMGQADVLAVGPDDLVWCLNTKGEVWRALDGKWQQLVEGGPDGKMWTYTIKQGDGLMAIVRQEFRLQDPQDTQEINQLVNLIVAQNGIKNRDRIKPGDVLTLRL